MPSIEKKEIAPGHIQLSVTLFREDIKPKIDTELKKYRQKAPIKGFRQGQAPISYIKTLYGKSIFYDKLLEGVNAALENEIKEIARPLGEVLPIEDNESAIKYSGVDNLQDSYTLHFEYGFIPDFELQGLDGSLTYEKFVVEGFDEIARQEFKRFTEANSTEIFPENDIQENDMLTISAQEVGTDFSTEFKILAENIPDPNLKQQILGLKKDDTFEFNIRNIEHFDDEKMFRKYILNLKSDDTRKVSDHFEGKITQVTRRESVPPSPEDMEKYFGQGIQSEEAAIEFLKNNISNVYNLSARSLSYKEVRDKLLAANQIAVPHDFLRKSLERNAKNNESLSDEALEGFVNEIRYRAIIGTIKEENQLFASEDEIRQRAIQEVSKRFRFKFPEYMVESIIARIRRNEPELLENIRLEIEAEKVIHFVMEKMTPSNTTVLTPEELSDKFSIDEKIDDSYSEPLLMDENVQLLEEQDTEIGAEQ